MHQSNITLDKQKQRKGEKMNERETNLLILEQVIDILKQGKKYHYNKSLRELVIKHMNFQRVIKV